MNVKNIFSQLFRPSRAQLEQKVAALIAEGKIPEAAQTHQTTQAQILDALRHFVQHPD